MQLSISHSTVYKFKRSPSYGLQQLRLTPKTNKGQTTIDWSLEVTGGEIQVDFLDENANRVHLVAIDPNSTEIEIKSSGTLDIENNHGVIGAQKSFAPLWYFYRQTSLTEPKAGVKSLLKELGDDLQDPVAGFHTLSKLIGGKVNYETGETDSVTTAEEAISLGKGVCQDHAHIFISAAREAGYPARYVSGYLMMNDRIDQEATHAWAEVHIPSLGWVGFDVSNGISPDDRYVRIATGLDYSQAAPISGMIYGGGGESLRVDIQVQQQ